MSHRQCADQSGNVSEYPTLTLNLDVFASFVNVTVWTRKNYLARLVQDTMKDASMNVATVVVRNNDLWTQAEALQMLNAGVPSARHKSPTPLLRLSCACLRKDQAVDVRHRRLAATLPLSPTHHSQLARPARGRAGLPPRSSLASGRGQGLPE
eukprot:COSAG02_NODE_5745_length_4072_cov_9.799899_4_plen_153_part_00